MTISATELAMLLDGVEPTSVDTSATMKTTYQYDASNNRTALIRPPGIAIESQTYDDDSQLSLSQNPRIGADHDVQLRLRRQLDADREPG